jgi:hypothetical protein
VRAHAGGSGIVKRRLFNLQTLLSLVLCVAVVVLWGRSYHYVDEAAYQSPRVGLVDWQAIVCSMGGHLVYSCSTHEYAVPPTGKSPPQDIGFSYGSGGGWDAGEAVFYVKELDRVQDAGTYMRLRGWGFHFARSKFHDTRPGQVGVYRTTKVHLPLWFLTTLFAFPPAYRSIRWWRRRRTILRGLCRRCGYDLRASPERCPECGTLVASERDA